jgi:hypothetical protein
MSKTDDPKTECRTPAKGRDGVTRIPSWKYDCLRDVIVEVVREAGSDGFVFSKLTKAVRPRLSADQLDKIGSLGWHVTTVKLNMEVEGDIARMSGSPQRLVVLR